MEDVWSWCVALEVSSLQAFLCPSVPYEGNNAYFSRCRSSRARCPLLCSVFSGAFQETAIVVKKISWHSYVGLSAAERSCCSLGTPSGFHCCTTWTLLTNGACQHWPLPNDGSPFDVGQGNKVTNVCITQRSLDFQIIWIEQG